MQSINESGSFDFDRRVLLLAVDDNDECEGALSWLLENLYRCWYITQSRSSCLVSP